MADHDHVKATDEMIEDFKKNRIGKVWVPHEPYFNTQATRDTIWHFVEGIGDVNPLFRDEEYAKKTKYGSIVAPPCFLFSVWWPGRATGLAGIHGWDSGKDWRFIKPIMEGDTISYTVTQTSLEERPSKMAGRIWEQHSDTEYKNQKGEVIAVCDGWTTRAERHESGKKGKYMQIEKQRNTMEDIEKIIAEVDAEEVRGSNPRYWEDVNIGDELQPVVKGPLTIRDMIAWMMGGGSPFMKAHKIYFDFVRRHSATVMIDHTTGELDAPEMVHIEDSRAQEIGIPAAYDYGNQRISWLGNLLTNWMGDDAFLIRMKASLRRFNLVGDTTRLKGKITDKYVSDDGEHCVDLECWGENQREEITMPGIATIALPSRDEDKTPVERRLG
ncbi:MaoC family dehydratase N-terminal domain-containing protein [Chloroflexota bacterium]